MDSALRIAIIDCGAGNLHSVRKAFAHQLPVGATLSVVTDASQLTDATHIVLPGVGAFADCMQGLHALPGMHVALEQKVLQQKTPFLGICVGMQMLFEYGYEYGKHEGLGWLAGEVRLLEPQDTTLKIPHMGWNKLRILHTHPFLKGIQDGDFVYFVHSYAVQNAAVEDVAAVVDYGQEIVSVIAKDHIVATQFHPEKSQRLGLQLIANFLQMQ